VIRIAGEQMKLFDAFLSILTEPFFVRYIAIFDTILEIHA
jgi:hypothetical protein